jgi:hypothetical protein
MTSTYSWLFLIGILVVLYKNPVFKGKMGEFIINVYGWFTLDSKEYPRNTISSRM